MYPDRQLANYVCQVVIGSPIKTKPHVRYVLQGMLNHRMKARCAYRAKKEDTSLKMAPKSVKSARREDSPPSHPCVPARIVLKVNIYIARARRRALIVRAEAIRLAQLPRDAYPAIQAPFRIHHAAEIVCHVLRANARQSLAPRAVLSVPRALCRKKVPLSAKNAQRTHLAPNMAFLVARAA